MTRRICLSIALLAVLALFWLGASRADGPTPAPSTTQPASAPVPRRGPVTVTVFSTNDIHEHMRGFARIAARVKAAKRIDPNVLFLDAGDAIGGGGHAALAHTWGEAMWRLMAAAGYDAVVFGNHCHGIRKSRIIELGKKYPDFPMLMANVDWKKETEDLSERFPPYKIFRLKGVTVGVIGACSHDMRNARPSRRFAVYYEPAAVHKWVPVVRKEADIVIAITHQYEDHDYKTGSGPNAPDLIVGGHSHGATATVWGKEQKSYLVKAGKYSRYLGKVVMTWDGRKISKIEGKVTKVDPEWPEEPLVKRLHDEYIQAWKATQVEEPKKK